MTWLSEGRFLSIEAQELRPGDHLWFDLSNYELCTVQTIEEHRNRHASVRVGIRFGNEEQVHHMTFSGDQVVKILVADRMGDVCRGLVRVITSLR